MPVDGEGVQVPVVKTEMATVGAADESGGEGVCVCYYYDGYCGSCCDSYVCVWYGGYGYGLDGTDQRSLKLGAIFFYFCC